jgi:hypothetical protein
MSFEHLEGRKEMSDIQAKITPVINEYFVKDSLTLKSVSLLTKFEKLVGNTNFYTAEVVMIKDQSSKRFNIVMTKDAGKYLIIFGSQKDAIS